MARGPWHEEADLVVVCEEPTCYIEQLFLDSQKLIRVSDAHHLNDKPGGVFLRKGGQLSPDDRVLLHAAARIVLHGRHGSLEAHLQHQKAAPVLTQAQTLALGGPRKTHVLIRGDFLRLIIQKVAVQRAALHLELARKQLALEEDRLAKRVISEYQIAGFRLAVEQSQHRAELPACGAAGGPSRGPARRRRGTPPAGRPCRRGRTRTPAAPTGPGRAAGPARSAGAPRCRAARRRRTAARRPEGRAATR